MKEVDIGLAVCVAAVVVCVRTVYKTKVITRLICGIGYGSGDDGMSKDSVIIGQVTYVWSGVLWLPFEPS